jgi:hypothetical protein
MLICGDDGLIMQVKARDEPHRDTRARAEQWIRKNAEAARGQADGTRRRLAQSRTVTFTSARGYTRTLSAVERERADQVSNACLIRQRPIGRLRDHDAVKRSART